MVNIIWIFFIVVGIIYSILTNKIDLLNNTIIESTKLSVDIIMKIFPVLALWMGLIKIAEKSNLLNKLSIKLYPILNKLFPDIPKNNESISLISSNIIANMFGLGSAATPLGLKAMQSLQKINNNKKVASRSMITFLVINASGLTIIPTTIISLRLMYDSANPSIIVLACIISTSLSTISGIIIDRLINRRVKN